MLRGVAGLLETQVSVTKKNLNPFPSTPYASAIPDQDASSKSEQAALAGGSPTSAPSPASLSGSWAQSKYDESVYVADIESYTVLITHMW